MEMSMDIKEIAIIGAALAAIAVVYGLAKLLKKKKVNTEGLLSAIDMGLNIVQPIADVLKPLLPGIAGEVVDTVLKYANGAVCAAEKTYKDALLTGENVDDTRQADCIDMVKKALMASGIEITEDTEKLINAVVPVFVLFLPKTHETTPTAIEEN